MDGMARQLESAVARWDESGWPRPRVMIVSGSGLAVDLGDAGGHSRPMGDFLPFGPGQVEGHPHAFDLLRADSDHPVLYQRGRLHSYQGYDGHQTAFSVRLGALLGVNTLILSNASGGLYEGVRAGDLMLIKDHINLIGLNPLRGELPADWGPHFPDLSTAYDPDLRRLARAEAAELGIELGEGVYAAVAGPSYETPAEVRMLRTMGADLVGMSTVLEVIAARHMGVRCLCFSLVANAASGMLDEPLVHTEVLAAAEEASSRLRELLVRLLERPELYAD
ncbi:MAG: purine-nucleoside phosphorylase [Thermoanaerobaculia bacterium]